MNKVFFGDCRDTMREMIARGVKVQMCVTSPPYFGLRDYGHDGQIGLESTPEEFVANMVEVFGLVRELLADDGVLWLNLGDSYASNQSNNGGYSEKSTLSGYTNPNTKGRQALQATKARPIQHGLKPKDLIGIPWRVAFALQADGWYLRQDIIWHKPNPMPESVTDRCTKAHEYIFLLSKRERYYFDSAVISEPASGPGKVCGPKNDASRGDGDRTGIVRGNGETRNKRSVWTVPTKPYNGAHFATFPPALIEPCILAGSRSGDMVLDPFFGSGTTGQVAQALGRRWVGCELNPDYAPLQQARTAQGGLEFGL